MRKRYIFRGRVQGVGFRASCREAASSLGVRGWVRNRPDGAVEMEAEADPGRLVELLARLRALRFPARVDAVDEMDAVPRRDEAEGFQVAY